MTIIKKLKDQVFCIPECCRKRKDVSDSWYQQDSLWMPLRRKHLVQTLLFYNFHPDRTNLEQANCILLRNRTRNNFENTPI